MTNLNGLDIGSSKGCTESSVYRNPILPHHQKNQRTMSDLNNLKTMEEKMKLDPNEIMENGLTRQKNEEIQKSTEGIQGVLGIVSMIIAFYAMYLVFSI